MNLSNNLKLIRLEHGINQTEMAKACDVSRQTIHAIEVSKYTPSVELALKIAKLLNLNVEELFSLKEKS
jgi:putative transcriptional regulator